MPEVVAAGKRRVTQGWRWRMVVERAASRRGWRWRGWKGGEEAAGRARGDPARADLG